MWPGVLAQFAHPFNAVACAVIRLVQGSVRAPILSTPSSNQSPAR